MAVISSYTTLLAEVASWVARSDLTAAIPGFVQTFEERFFRNPKNYGQWMASALSVSFSSTAAVPSDFLALRVAYLDGQSDKPLQQSSLEQVLQMYPRSTSGKPKWIARDGTGFIFGPVPDGTYTLNGTYYAKPTVLRSYTGDAAAHWLVVNAPDLLLYGSLMEAEPYIMNEKRLPLWQAKYAEALDEYRSLVKAQNVGLGSLQTLVV